MKNSSKYLLAAVLVLLASLTGYNMALRAEYRRGTYKDPLHDYTTLPLKDFTTVEVPAFVSVKIVAGPFGVRMHPDAAEYVHVRQQGKQLVITAAFARQVQYVGRGPAVVISCPHLTALRTDGVYKVKNERQIRKNSAGGETVLVQGFTQDSLLLSQDNGSRIELAGNKLGYLRATAGRSPGSHALLQLNAGNQVAAADVTIGHQSELLLDNVLIPKLHYQFGDSVKVTMLGRALSSLPH
jgi:hypothetical protein